MKFDTIGEAIEYLHQEVRVQQEIRNYLKDGLGNVWADGRDGKGVDLDTFADNILTYLHSRGVVLKVEREILGYGNWFHVEEEALIGEKHG